MVKLNILLNIWKWFDEFLKKMNLDGLIQQGIDIFFTPLHEFFKIIIVILLAIIIILGTIQLAKKFFKLLIAITIILVVVYFVSGK